jgi:hypothetical protein
MYLSITGVTADHRLAKYLPFESESDADAHAAKYDGFVVDDPGGMQELWTIDVAAKTVTRDVSVEQTATENMWWARLREQRNSLLTATDWWASSDLSITSEQTNYRQALRDLPANTPDPADPIWPTTP